MRATAIEAACYIFAEHWSTIPESFRSELLHLLVHDLSHDTGSVNCRIAVLAGLTFLFDRCPRSRKILKLLLPLLADLLNDGKDHVKNLYLDLLISVQSVFPDLQLPSAEILVGLLDSSSPGVSKRAGALLLDTYFPLSQTPRVKYQKCQELIGLGTAAALAFYSNLPIYLAKSNASREAISTLVCLLLEDEALSLPELEVAAVLLGGIKPHLKSKACKCLSGVLGGDAIEALLARFSGQLPEMSAIFKIVSVCPDIDADLSRRLLSSAGSLLESPASAAGVFEFLLHSKQLDVYVCKVVGELIASLAKQMGCSGPAQRPKKRAKPSVTPAIALVKKIQSITLHSAPLANLMQNKDFSALLRSLRNASESVKGAPEDVLAAENRFLVSSTELLFRLSILAVEYRVNKNETDQVSF